MRPKPNEAAPPIAQAGLDTGSIPRCRRRLTAAKRAVAVTCTPAMKTYACEYRLILQPGSNDGAHAGRPGHDGKYRSCGLDDWAVSYRHGASTF